MENNKGLTFKTIEEMKACTTDEHVCAFCEEDNKFYAFHEGEWIIIEENMEQLMPSPMQLYELNKQFVSQLPPLSDQDLQDRKEMVDNWVNEDVEFYLLYGREISYFTLFQRSKDENITESVSDILLECLAGLGQVVSMDVLTELEEPTIEIWVKIAVEGQEEDFVTVLYLFDYTKGVEKFRG
jgi:hypothetical protein